MDEKPFFARYGGDVHGMIRGLFSGECALDIEGIENLHCCLTFGWELSTMVSRWFRSGPSCHMSILANQNTGDGGTGRKGYGSVKVAG